MNTSLPRVHANVCSPRLLSVPGSFLFFFSLICLRAQSQTCNDLSTVSLDNSCTVTVTPDMVLEGSYTDSLFTVSLFTLSGMPLGNPITVAQLGQTVQATVTENATGNYCQGFLVVEDHLPPAIACTDITLPCAVPQFTPGYLADVLHLAAARPTITENCGAYTLDYVDTWTDLGCDNPADLSAEIVRVWTVTDASGNQASCTQHLFIKRVHVFQVGFPGDTVVGCTNPLTDPAHTGQPFFKEFGVVFPLYPDQQACELSAVFQDQILTVCPGSYKILRTWTIHDDCLPASSDPGSLNPLQHIQIIHVKDQAGPVFACPTDMVIYTDPFVCSRSFDLPDVLLSDDCSGPVSIRADWTAAGIPHALDGTLADFPGNNHWDPDTLGVLGIAENLPAGIVIFRYLATDACGNTSTCTFRVTVSDGVPPLVACDEFTQVALGNTGMALIPAETFDDGSLDNCSPVYFKARRVKPNDCQPVDRFFDKVKFCCDDVGDTVAVILRVYDLPVDTGAISLTAEENHANECLVYVFVDDKQKPQCSAPLNTTVSCGNFDPSLWAYGKAAFQDNCCLDTVFELKPNYTQFDTFCNRGTIVRTWRAFDCHGLSNQCTQRVIVNYEQNFSVKFPDDVVVSDCDTTGVYGPVPEIYEKDCERIAIAFHDEVSAGGVQSCYRIERVWTIINWCGYNSNLPLTVVPNPNPSPDPLSLQNLPGPVVAPQGHSPAPSIVRVSPTDPTLTDYSKFWSANTNGYEYRQIISVHDDVPPKIRGCPIIDLPVQFCDHTKNDPQFWNHYTWTNPMITGSHDLCEGPTELAVTASDGCSKGNINIRYLLFLDLDGDGEPETVINSINPPPADTVYFGNAKTPNFSGGVARPFDQRPVPPNEKYRFTLQLTGFVNRTGYVRWHTAKDPTVYVTPQLPHGKHRILWIIEDGCGNETYCDYPIQVRDCRNPDLVCINGLSTDITPDETATLWATDFLLYTDDNCTPPDQIQIGIRKSGTGFGFPIDAAGKPVEKVVFSCDELGPQPVEIWARDAAGNMNTCETYVLVQDNFSICSNTQNTVAGLLHTEAGDPLEEATVHLSGSSQAFPQLDWFNKSDANGIYRFFNALPIGMNGTLTPVKDNDPLNGVSTFDLVLINRHILGQQLLDSPYKMIAADVNGSRSITTFDILELRKLILGTYTDIPDNTSWRFVSKNYTFPNPLNPFEEVFPESRDFEDLQFSVLGEDFVAVKIGDVNGNAVTNSAAQTTDRSVGTAWFDVRRDNGRREVKAGDLVTVHLQTATPIWGYQFTLSHPDLELQQLLPDEGLDAGNFALFPAEHLLTSSWNSAIPADAGFTLVFRAEASGLLDQMLTLSSRKTRAEAYTGETTVEKSEPALRFADEQGAHPRPLALELYPNEPNPWNAETRLQFYLPESGELTLTVYDAAGRTLYTDKAVMEKGYRNWVLRWPGLPQTGMLYYRIQTAHASKVGNMVRQ